MRKIFKRISYALLICLLILSSINPIYAESGDEIELTIFHTTDTHGRIENMGKIFHIINESRENSSNVLILDSGDTIQGNLPAFYFKGEHALKIMDAMSYDAITLGNHDFNFGKDMLTEKSKEVDFPFLSANIIEEKDSIDYVGKSIEAAKPYIIKDINGIKVAILGLTTPTIKDVEREKNIKGLQFIDTIEVSKKYAPILRQKADIVIALTHQDVDIDKQIAEEVDGIDLILAGHQHKVVFETPIEINNTVIAKGTCFGKDVTKMDIKLIRKDGKYKIQDISGQLITISDDMPEDPTIRDMIDDYNSQLSNYQDTEIVTVEGEFSAIDRRTSETSMGNLMVHMMKDITGADIAIEELWTDNALNEGINTVNDIFNVFPYENVIMKAELTGEQLKEVLENNANNYGTTYFCNIDGIKVTYDLTNPDGQKVVDVIYNGKPISEDQKFVVATDSYLASGGFGFTTYKDSNLIIDDDLWTRESFVKWLKEQEMIKADDYKDYGNVEILYKEQSPTIVKLKSAGIFTGYPDGGFYGDKLMTKAEYIVSLGRVFDVEMADGENASHWSYGYVKPLVDNDIITKECIENPDEEISNNEAIDIANAMLNKYGYSILGSETITEHRDNLQRADAAVLISKVYDIVHPDQ